MITRFKITLFFTLIAGFVNSQKINRNLIDSLIIKFETSSGDQINNFDDIDNFCAELNEKSRSINYNEGILTSCLILAETYRDFAPQKTNSVITTADSLINIGTVDFSLLIRYYLIKGYLYGGKGDFLLELTHYLKADSIANKENVEEAKRYVNQSICSYYVANQEYDNALVLARKNMLDVKKDTFSYFVDIENIAIIYSYIGDNDSAIFYLNKAINEGYGNYTDLHYQYFSIGRSYLDLNMLDSAKKYLDSALSISKEKYSNTVDIANIYNSLGLFYKKKNIFDSAFVYYTRGYVVSDSINYIHGIFNSSQGKLITALNQINRDDIITYFKEYVEAKDTILNRGSKGIEKKYLIENETLKKEAKIKELELKKESDKNHRILLYSIFSLLLIVFAFIVYRYILNQKILKKNLEIKEYKRIQIERDLKEKEKELASTINIIQSNIKIIEDLKSKEEKQTNISDITSVFEQNYISDTQWQNIIIQFESIHPNYLLEIKINDAKLTINDTKLIVLLKLGYTNQSIAEILNISIDGVKKAKYRLKKKVKKEVI